MQISSLRETLVRPLFRESPTRAHPVKKIHTLLCVHAHPLDLRARQQFVQVEYPTLPVQTYLCTFRYTDTSIWSVQLHSPEDEVPYIDLQTSGGIGEKNSLSFLLMGSCTQLLR